MGGEVSRSSELVSTEPINYLAIMIKEPDRLHLVPYETTVGSMLSSIFNTFHTVQEEGDEGRCSYLVQLAGQPFASPTIGENEQTMLGVKVAWCHLLSRLADSGWRVLTASDLAQRRTRSTVFFRKMVPQLAPDPELTSRPQLCVSPSSWDKLYVIHLPASIESKVTSLMETGWGIKEARILQTNKHGCVIRYKLNGSPWMGPSGAQNIQLRQLVLDLVKMLQEHGFNFVTNLNINGGPDSLFFEQTDNRFSLATPESMFLLSINRTDRLRLVAAPPEAIHLVARAIHQAWPGGVQQVKEYHSSQEFKLSGNPWWTDGEECVQARQLLSCILVNLRTAGWTVLATINLSKETEDKAVFILHQLVEDGVGGEKLGWLCLSFHDTSRIRVAATSEAELTSIAPILRQNLADGNLVIKERKVATAIEWKVAGSPFSGLYGTGDAQREMLFYLCRLLGELNGLGWKLCSSADISAKYLTTKKERYPVDVHSWFFILEPKDRLHLAFLNPPLSAVGRYLRGDPESPTGPASSQFDGLEDQP